MKLVLDTNAYCFCDRGHEAALIQLSIAEEIYLPSVVYGELYYGFKYGSKFKDNLKRLNRFIDKFNVIMINVNSEVAKNYGDIFAYLRQKAKPIPSNDVWVAACAVFVGGVLLTEDQHFKHIDQIQVEYISWPR